MEKLNFKKLALLGIAGGSLIAAQGIAEEPKNAGTEVAEEGTLLAGNCGHKSTAPTSSGQSTTVKTGGHGCGSGGGCNHRKDPSVTPAPQNGQVPATDKKDGSISYNDKAGHIQNQEVIPDANNMQQKRQQLQQRTSNPSAPQNRGGSAPVNTGNHGCGGNSPR